MLNRLEQELIDRKKENVRSAFNRSLASFQLSVRLLRRAPGYGWNFLRTRYYLRRSSQLKGLVLTKGKPSIENAGYLEIGHSVRIWSTVFRSRIAVKKGGRIVIGDHCLINGAIIAATREVIIGANCRLAPFTHIMDGDFHDLRDREAEGNSAPIVIEDDVWLGARSMVLKGVTIGRGAVVTPGAVVTRDVPPYAVVSGVPARVIKLLRPKT